MKRRDVLLATSGVLTTSVAGCLDAGSDSGDQSGATGTPTVERRDGRRIVVSNTGEAMDDPDLAVLDFDVEATGDTAAAVRDELSTRSAALREALLGYGLPEDAITSSSYRINERIDRRQMERDGVRPDSEEAIEEYRYYHGSHSFTVEVEAIDEVGDVIDTAVDAGADEVGRVTYTLSDEKRTELREQALRSAIEQARSEADAIADEVGTDVVEARVIDASEGRVSPVTRDLSYGGADATETETAPPTTIDTGDVTVTANVRIEFVME